jgi:5-methylcytosine-specific restriction endonuclease McrA
MGRKKRKRNPELERLFSEATGICCYCQRKTILTLDRIPLMATVEHIVPLSKGGAKSGDNTSLSCRLCNNMKGNLLPQEWAEFMASHPRWWLSSKRARRKARKIVLSSAPTQSAPMVLRGGYWIEK